MQTIDEKKGIIVSLLAALRRINPEIGQYEKSILNEHLQYAVRLSNGRLLIPQDTVHDYEQSPDFVTAEQFTYAASTFIPSQVSSSYRSAESNPATAVETPYYASSSYTPASYPEEKQKSSTIKRALIFAFIVLVVLSAYFIYGQISREHQVAQTEGAKERVRNNITDYVTVGYDDYKYSNLGGIYGLVVHLSNSSDYMMENVKITITYIKKNGDVWRNRDYDFEMLSPHSKGTIKIPDTDRGVSIKVRISAIKSAALDL